MLTLLRGSVAASMLIRSAIRHLSYGMIAKTAKARVAEHAKRMRDQGLMKVCVWIPKDKAEQRRKYAKRLKPKE